MVSLLNIIGKIAGRQLSHFTMVGNTIATNPFSRAWVGTITSANI